MEKYLFTDGTGEIREVHSEEELNVLVKSATHPDKIRIWLFSSNEWISYAAFSGRSYPAGKKIATVTATIEPDTTEPPARKTNWLKKTLLFTLAGTTVFLVYNFTRIKWERIAPLNVLAARPANIPSINTDSVIEIVEAVRGKGLDKITRTNLRIRNTWPERILLQLDAERETRGSTTRYSNIHITLDNATGYLIDEAIVKLTVWKKNEAPRSDTIRFSSIGYATPARQDIQESYRGDSIAVSFYSIKAKSFNFCYSMDKQSNYGNMGDRWFCK
jgi:hypothetical protein